MSLTHDDRLFSALLQPSMEITCGPNGGYHMAIMTKRGPEASAEGVLWGSGGRSNGIYLLS